MILFYISGLTMLIIGIFLWTDAYAFRAEAETIRGKLFGYRQKIHGNGYVYYPVVEYHDGGEVFYVESSVGGNSREYRIGEPVDVLVVGNDHSQARLKQKKRPLAAVVISLMGLLFSAIYFAMTFDVIMLVIAVVLIPAGVILLRKSNPIPAQGSTEHTGERHQRKEFGSVPDDVTDDLIRENATHDEIASKDAHIWMFAIGAVTLLVALFWFQDIKSLTDVSVKATGTIVAKHRSLDDGRSTYAPVVSFRHDAYGTVRFTGSNYSSHPFWQIGDHVTVLYDPAQVSKAMIDQGFNFGGPLAMGLISIFSFAMGRYLYRRKMRFEKFSAMEIYP
jgi:hypothetical protein